ncbi:MAG TPA: hypothetical protein VI306_06290 [Pyrinomonadaceae bacterium]
MNEEYLWDKSGEPDPEIKQLEDVLGTLRYQPRPLQLPELTNEKRKKGYLPWLAIAAALLVALFAGVVWLKLQSGGLKQNQEAVAPKSVQSPKSKVTPSTTSTPEEVVPENKIVQNNAFALHQRKDFVAINRSRQARTPAVQTVPSKEALLAKEQLLSALRLASEKLNFAQRKVQGPAGNPIRNQHKIG